jgi:putative NADPH-quinone reductase
MAKNVLIINGHPDQDSFNYALSRAYATGCQKANANVHTINIAELKFNPNLQFGYKKDMELEADLQNAIEKIKQADHIAFLYPLWWGSYPAVMKGFIDRIFLPKAMFDHDAKGKREKLLKGKSGRIITTMEQPVWFYKFILLSPATRQLKNITLGFCGVKNIRSTYFGSIASSTKQKRENWLREVEDLGLNDAR